MKALHKRIINVDLWDKPYIINNHASYRKEKRRVNKKLRQMAKKEYKEDL